MADLRSEVTREASATVVTLAEAAGTCASFPTLVLEARSRRACRACAWLQRSAVEPFWQRARVRARPDARRRGAQTLLAPMLKLVAVPHKVMSEHGNIAASAAFSSAQSHRVAARLAEQQQDRRAPVALRARCAEYLARALAEWNEEVLGREPEIFEAAIAAGVGDASADVRARTPTALHILGQNRAACGCAGARCARLLRGGSGRRHEEALSRRVD